MTGTCLLQIHFLFLEKGINLGRNLELRNRDTQIHKETITISQYKTLCYVPQHYLKGSVKDIEMISNGTVKNTLISLNKCTAIWLPCNCTEITSLLKQAQNLKVNNEDKFTDKSHKLRKYSSIILLYFPSNFMTTNVLVFKNVCVKCVAPVKADVMLPKID